MASPRSLFVRIQYPQSVGPLSEDRLDTFLHSMQKTQTLYEYTCTLNTLTFPSGETIPMDAPSLYCKTAPSYVTTRSDALLPLLLVELVFVVAVSASEADLITETIDDLIRKHLLPEKSNVSIKILVTSINGDQTTQKNSYFANSGRLPLPYYQLHETLVGSRMNISVVILLAILCLGILLLNIAFHVNYNRLHI